MPNQHIGQRLAGIQSILNGVHQAGGGMSAATKGQERAAFIDSFLSQSLPPVFRFGTGDATDSSNNRSGQLDVVVEYPFAPSLPLSVGTSRLYLAEGVAAVIEVKSDVAGQWSEVQSVARQLAPLSRNFGASMTFGGAPSSQIPLFVAGYTGWKQMATVEQHLASEPSIAGILVINPGIFVSSQKFRGIRALREWSLWGLIASLYGSINSLLVARNDPLDYAKP